MSLNRKTGDSDIDYLVNDGNLNLESIAANHIVVVGERHANVYDENNIRKLIKAFKPDYVLVEGLADYKLHSRNDKLRKLNQPIQNHYYEGFTKRWIDFSLEFNMPFIGLEYIPKDDTEWYDKVSLVESFKRREKHFINVIENYRINVFGQPNKVIAICGDTHLRTIATRELGVISPLYLKYNGKPDSVVIRSMIGEIH